MERHSVLADLNRCVLPPGFSETIGDNSGRIEHCLKGMLCPDTEKRIGCKNVRECMESFLEDTESREPSPQ